MALTDQATTVFFWVPEYCLQISGRGQELVARHVLALYSIYKENKRYEPIFPEPNLQTTNMPETW
jgi:hypothetical protein